MATIQDDEENKSKMRPVGGGTSYLGGGYTGAGSSAAPSYGQSTRSTGGSRFTNIGQLLMGGEQQGQELGSQVAAKGEEAGKQAESDIGTLHDTGSMQVIGGTPSLVESDVKRMEQSTAPDEQMMKLYESGTIPRVQAPAAPQAFSYTGPSEVSKMEGYGKAQESTQKAKEMINTGLGTFEGTQKLLSQNRNTPYSTGQSAYDTMFARTFGQPKIEATRKRFGQIEGLLGTTEKSLTDRIGGAQAATKDVNQAWADAYEKAQRQAGETNLAYQKLEDTTATRKQQEAEAKRLEEEKKTRQEAAWELKRKENQKKLDEQLAERQAWIAANLRKQDGKYVQKAGRSRSLIGDMLGEQNYKWKSGAEYSGDLGDNSPYWWNDQTIQNYLMTGKMPWENKQV